MSEAQQSARWGTPAAPIMSSIARLAVTSPAGFGQPRPRAETPTTCVTPDDGRASAKARENST